MVHHNVQCVNMYIGRGGKANAQGGGRDGKGASNYVRAFSPQRSPGGKYKNNGAVYMVHIQTLRTQLDTALLFGMSAARTNEACVQADACSSDFVKAKGRGGTG